MTTEAAAGQAPTEPTNGAVALSTPGQQSGAAAVSGAAPAGNWYDGFDDETKGFIQLKGWKDQKASIESYRNLEKMVGVPQDQLIRMPKADDAEGWAKVYDKLGRPAKAEEYKIQVPDGMPDGFAKSASNWFHEAGLNQSQAEKLTAQWNQHMAQEAQAYESQREAEMSAELAALRNEWPGKVYDERLELGRRAAREFGLDAEKLERMESALGTAGLLKHMAEIGAKLGTDKFIDGERSGGNGFGMTPDMAKARIAELRHDKEWVAKYLNGDAKAKAEMDRLNSVAYLG